VIDFTENLGKNLQIMSEQIVDGTIEVGNYHYFKIFDPKERQICAASFTERVLHHALMNVCHPMFETYQIYDSYASRPDKGTYAAIKRAELFTKQNDWFLKLDFRKFFDSIDHDILKKQLYRKIKDTDLLVLFYRIIDSYETIVGKGLPIGNLTSQYFANHYLAFADHHAKETLTAHAYVRYMDDIVIWHNDKNALLAMGRTYETFCFNYLKLELKQFCLNYTLKGVPFLGYLIYKNQTKLAQKSKRRFLNKLRQYQQNFDEGCWNETEFQRHLLPLIAFAQKANTLALRKEAIWAMNEGY
jgi:RNA-directed DNA polymerase